MSARTGDLELRWIDDELLPVVADVAARGIHGPDCMPFSFPWTRGSAAEVARNVLAYQWANRPLVGPEKLTIELAVLAAGRPIGVQAASGDNWSVLRSVETGSWLGKEFQGRGIGSRMRVLMLHLLFEGLNAHEVTSAAFADNPASNAISRRVGYQLNGHATVAREGAAAIQKRYRMTAQRWREVSGIRNHILSTPIELAGMEAFRRQIDRSELSDA